MPGEKDLNANLFDQLTLVERIARQAAEGDIDAVKEEIDILIKRSVIKWMRQGNLIIIQ